MAISNSLKWGAQVYQPIESNESFYVTPVVGKSTFISTTTIGINEDVLQLSQSIGELYQKTVQDLQDFDLSKRANLFLRLCAFDERIGAYNERIDNTLWITVFNVILLILTLGMFSLRDSYKAKEIFPDPELFFDKPDDDPQSEVLSHVKQGFLSTISFETLSRFSPEQQCKIAERLGCKETFLQVRDVLQKVKERSSEMLSLSIQILDAQYQSVEEFSLYLMSLTVEGQM